jgi:hypothetical protein
MATVRQYVRTSRRGMPVTVKEHNRTVKGKRWTPQVTTGALQNNATGQFDKGRGNVGMNVPAGYTLILDDTDLNQTASKVHTTLGRTEGKGIRVIHGRKG